MSLLQAQHPQTLGVSLFLCFYGVMHGHCMAPGKAFLHCGAYSVKSPSLKKYPSQKNTPIWVSFSSIFRGEPQNVEFAFFESLDCSFGVRFSKGTGADVPDAAMIWPDA